MARTSHSNYVLQQLNNQREWGFLCDCCIAIDDIYFQAHKAVLAACSSYFRMFFMNHQHTTAQLNLSNMKISAECFDLILQFMYLGKIMTAPANFEQFKVAMNYLQLYNVPECLEDIQDTDSSSLKCSSSASSTQNSKMIFGVRMYEDTLARNGSETNRWGMEPPSSTVNTSHNKEPEEEALQLSSFPEQLFDVCKKSTTSKYSHTKERVSHSRRFGRSFTCDSCGFSFSCEKLLDEHVLSCTNRHSYQSARYYGAEKIDFNEKDSASKIISTQTEKCKGDSSQVADDSSSPVSNITSRKSSTVASETSGEEGSRASERKRIVIKMEPEDSPADELKDYNIIKVTDKDCNESSDNDDLDDEQEEPLYRYYVEEEMREKRNARKTLKPRLSMDEDERRCLKSPRHLNRKAPSVQEDVENAPCELCGLTITEEDLSSHYLSKHIENICACGKCGQILVKGKQLQDHAQTCGEPQDLTMNGIRNSEEKMDLEENPEEQSEIRDMMFADMLEDFRDSHFQMNSLQKKQLYKHSACPFRCPNCGQRFETENLVVEHMSNCLEQDLFKNSMMEENERDHRRKHFCNLCGKGFYQRCHLREHYTVHTKEKQFVCQTCGKQFLRERQLRLHNDMHKGMARYVCSICDQGNFRKHDHVRHMISHLSAGETICQVCFQIFPNNEQLEQHMDVHLYTCGVCGAKFNLRKDMRSHYNAKHLKRT
ncbi:zinc finger and BTB domain-containing protein 1 isoform X1 [Gallus gallus]|uniref:Zinc finger and BTB domain-containing protein 1 n=2 Tax=Gallus gallus TaxID=9031 RepID=F1NNE5_CHICK|nr:zinc finger and BTB domain-containing protein 1 isoform 2 [Gallus gallus]XP_015143361.1 zinc finger and BTB domain-containing protein 1 isoform X1 [Gallus gallus]XP_015143362.1 zinc finger and BTB domain-containing protein 1 isoform X1 [Gallus gallus]XP_015143363.1 zinc finger and BTB domain-containing protein 1 isoform X1 [Gallus gallus]XP_040527947.1 zinc finger and BTB domain-containing protein 1 isoform X1 [Gallus gallus]XP_040527948.1 zinc finger and BTB domain-containing protein 1 iso|eukprot:XP_015143361.1 zinc finger and BTB domain-containing protein 1 isoform X1 [Gallus gallus]